MRNFAIIDDAATSYKIFHQLRMVNAIIDSAAWLFQLSIKTHRLRAADIVVMPKIAIAIRRPMVTTEHVFTRNRHMVVSHGVQQANIAEFFRSAFGINRYIDVALAQIETEMQSGGAGSDDGDLFFEHRLSPYFLVGA